MRRIAYHITDSVNTESILANGLRASIGPRSAELGETVKSVYLFPSIDDLENALGNWLGEYFAEDSVLNVFEVDVTGFMDDSTVEYEIEIARDIPRDRLKLSETVY